MTATRMRLGIDARSLSRGASGVATYVSALLERIPYLDPIRGDVRTNNFLWNQMAPPLAGVHRGWVGYHAPGYTAPLVGCRPLVLSAHDVSYLAAPDWYPYQIGRIRRWYYVSSLRRADRIIVPSDFSRAELLRLYPEFEGKVRKVALGVSSRFYPDPEGARRARTELSLPEKFLLHVGDIHTRRNIPVLVGAAEATGLPLVLVGSVLAGGERFADWPLRFESLPADVLRGVYGAASAFVYGSAYEGFGLPVLEAMACGTPVVAARTSSIPEVCGQACVLVAPELDAFVQGIGEALKDRDSYSARGVEQASRFSWDTTARQTEAVYREVASV